jgi:hypothetical protein
MPYFVRSSGSQPQEILCRTKEQAEDIMNELKNKFPSQEVTVVPSGETKFEENEKVAVPSKPGYGLSRARPRGLRPAARGGKGFKSSSKGGISARSGRKRKKKPGQKKWGTK